MLVTLSTLLKHATEKQYAIGHFNVVTLEQLEGVLQAAEEADAPLSVGVAEAFLEDLSMEAVLGAIRVRAERSKVPVAMHFDHGRTFSNCVSALKLGCTSIMFDGSALSFEENVSRTAEIAKVAHAFGASVEGELGAVAGSEDGSEEIAGAMTNPLLASDYVKRTSVDALAVAVGNAHGRYALPPKLDFDLIRRIAEKAEVPLVLHGGSGLAEADYCRAIKEGIRKINVFTEINFAQGEVYLEQESSGNTGVLDVIPNAIRVIRSIAHQKLALFGSAGKGASFSFLNS